MNRTPERGSFIASRLGLLPALALLAVGTVAPSQARAQTGTVTGTVLNAETGELLEGVQVTLAEVGQEARLGGLSGAQGRFLILQVPVGQYVVRALLIGFATETQVVDVVDGMPSLADFRLKPEPIALSEIVVTGVIGSTQRTKLPFDVAQVRVADLPVPSVNAAQSLQGKVAGAQVVQTSGRPGATPSILLRGVTSLDASGRSQAPLYIVDEVIVGADLVDLSSLDIQSIEVVKGAAAASLYGSRAGNGVVHIRTKRGAEMAESQIRYTLRSELGGSVLGRRPKQMFPQAHRYAMTSDSTQFLNVDGTPCDWLECTNLALAGQTAGGGPPGDWNTYQSNPWPGTVYDQLERFFRHGGFLQNQLTVEGRSGSTNFLVSGSNLDQGGIVRFLPDFSRSNFRVNLDQALREDLSVRSTVFYSRSTGAREHAEIDALNEIRRVAPVVDLLAPDPEDPEELVFVVGPDNQVNPLYDLQTINQEEWRSRFLGSATIQYTPQDWLDVEGNFSFDRGDLKQKQLWPKGYRTMNPSWLNDGRLVLLQNTSEALNGSVTASLRWEPSEEIRNLTQLRYLIESQTQQGFWADGYQFAASDVPVMTNVNQETLLSESTEETMRADGYFLITDFDLFDRYVVDALIRNDGSSLFGEDERRQWYYRLGAAWRVSQEDFFRAAWVDELKLRYSVGTAGGRPRFSAQYETFDVEAGRISPNRLGNRDLKPEHSTEHEAGVDLSLLDFKVGLSLTYARTTTENQILQVPLPTSTGYLSQWRNAGTLESRSWEATLDLRLLERPTFTWAAKLLYDATTTKITALDLPPFYYGSPNTYFYAREGEEIGTFYGVILAKECAHLPEGMSCDAFTVNDEGYLVWVGEGGSLADKRWGDFGPQVGDVKVAWGAPFPGFCIDRVSGEQTQYCPTGKSMPDYNLGFSTTFTWKGLSAYALLSRSAGFSIRNFTFANVGLSDQRDVPEEDRKPIGYFGAFYGPQYETQVQKGDFTKLREVSLAYRMGPELLGRVRALGGVQSLTLRLSGQNLFTWSDYPGYDPDVGFAEGNTGSAVISRQDWYAYPHMRTFTGSVEVVF